MHFVETTIQPLNSQLDLIEVTFQDAGSILQARALLRISGS